MNGVHVQSESKRDREREISAIQWNAMFFKPQKYGRIAENVKIWSINGKVTQKATTTKKNHATITTTTPDTRQIFVYEFTSCMHCVLFILFFLVSLVNAQ